VEKERVRREREKERWIDEWITSPPPVLFNVIHRVRGGRNKHGILCFTAHKIYTERVESKEFIKNGCLFLIVEFTLQFTP
jgi:hypothetical protein